MTKSNHVSESELRDRLVPLGRALFGTGIGLVALRGIEIFTRMPGLPAFWYANQPLWIALGLGLTALGWQILWGRPVFETRSWRPSVPGRRFRTATLYVSEGCHLCDEAASVLAEYHSWLPVAEEIDIRSDLDLVDRFGTCVPVVMLDGKVRFRGKINETLLRRLIEGTLPVSSSGFSTSL